MQHRTSRLMGGATRSRIAVITIAAFAALGLQGCGNSSAASDLPTSMDELVKQAQQEGEVDWSAPKPQAQMQAAIDLFEKKYPGITVKFTNTKAPDQVSQLKVQQAAHKVAIDVAAAGELTVPPSLKLADTVDWSKYGVDKDATAFDNQMIYIWASPKVWAYNTTQMKSADVPKTWDDILKLGIPGSKMAIEGRGSFMTAWNVNKDLGPAQGKAWAKKLAAKKPHYTTNTTESEQLIESGQAAFGTSLMNLALAGKDSGAHVAIAPVNITSTNETFIYVPKGAPHPAAAVLFSSFLSSDDAQAALAKHYNSRIPRNTDCSDPKLNAVVQTLCSNNIKWSSTGSIDAYNSLTDFFPEIEKALGTYTG